jgi:hypothetical protein
MLYRRYRGGWHGSAAGLLSPTGVSGHVERDTEPQNVWTVGEFGAVPDGPGPRPVRLSFVYLPPRFGPIRAQDGRMSRLGQDGEFVVRQTSWEHGKCRGRSKRTIHRSEHFYENPRVRTAWFISCCYRVGQRPFTQPEFLGEQSPSVARRLSLLF